MGVNTFKQGDNNPYIAKIQRALNEIMQTTMATDGSFGPTTAKVLSSWQASNQIPVTGAYSDKTAAVLDIYIDRRFLTEEDFQAASVKLNCELASIKAVENVESSGQGFFQNGKTEILFERHIFKKQLDAWLALSEANVRAVASKVALIFTPGQQLLPTLQAYLLKTQSDIYNTVPGGYIGGVKEYDRLAKAGILNLDAGYKSCSWGMFQIMGYWFSTLKFASVSEMVAAFQVSEDNQLIGFCEFILADHRLTTAIQTKNWLSLAQGYNGASEKGYDQRLAAAYAKFKV